jgi:hypothetical protein
MGDGGFAIGARDEWQDRRAAIIVSADTVPQPNRVFQSFSFLQWLLLSLVTGACVVVTWMAAKLLGWPTFMRQEASVLASAAPMMGIATAVVSLAICIPLGTLLAGRLRFDAGMFTAAIGLAALAARGGPVSGALRSTANPRLYLTLALESVMLLGLLGLAWQWLALLRRWGWVQPEPRSDDAQRAGPLAQQAMACLVQATVTALLILLLAQSDAKKQIMAAVAVGSLLGGIAAHQTFAVAPSAPFWIGPSLTAIAGYVWALKAPGRWAIGMPANALASASPLDYASLGTAGAILGYWVSRVWKQEPAEMEIEEGAVDE